MSIVSPDPRWSRAVVCALVAAYLAIAVSTAWMDSVTGDEVAHLPAGYSYVTTGDFRLNIQHPPLVKMLAGAALVPLDLEPVGEIPGWEAGDEWTFGRHFLTANRVPLRRIVFVGRLPMILVGLFLGLAMWWWSRQLWGEGAAVGVLLLFAFGPNLLAHARLVTTDVGVSAFTVATVAALWKLSVTRRLRWAVVASVALGLALLAKYSGLVTAGLAGLLVVADWGLRRVWPRREAAAKEGPHGAGARREGTDDEGVSEAPVGEPRTSEAETGEAPTGEPPTGEPVASGSGADDARAGDVRTGRRLGDAALAVVTLALLTVVPAVMVALLFDPPHGLATYREGFGRIYADHNPSWEAYLWGEWSGDGFWHYYLLAQIWKTPLPLLGLFFGSFFLIRWNDRRSLRNWLYVLAPIAAFHAAGVYNSANIGIRHVMPVFPFLMIAAGAAIRWLLERGRAARLALAALLVWYVGGTLAAYPHFIPYFNELAGGPAGGNRYLDDSNVTWGESFYHLRDYLEKHPVEDARLEAFTGLDVEAFGIEVPKMDLRDVVWPVPGRTYFAGASVLRRSELSMDYPGIRFEWLERGYRPVDRVGSILVYRFALESDGGSGPEAERLDPDVWMRDAVDQLERILERNPTLEEAGHVLAEVSTRHADWLEARGSERRAFIARLRAARLARALDPAGRAYRRELAEAVLGVLLYGEAPAWTGPEAPPVYLEALDDLEAGREAEGLYRSLRAIRLAPGFAPARELARGLLERFGFPRLGREVAELEVS